MQQSMTNHTHVSTFFCIDPNEPHDANMTSTLSFGSSLKMSSVGSVLRSSFNTKEVGRTVKLLDTERASKTNSLRKMEKIERDLTAYQFSVKEKDNRIADLNNRLKSREKEWFTQLDLLRKENRRLKLEYDITHKRSYKKLASRENSPSSHPKRPKSSSTTANTSPSRIPAPSPMGGRS
jgi:hypothetical protein